MHATSINDIPKWIETRILLSLDFSTVLNARTTCRRWNETLQDYLGQIAILNIRMDKSTPSKKFRRGKWDGSLLANYSEIRLIPKDQSPFIHGKVIRWNHSSFQNFHNVVKFTLFENGSFLHFIHRYMVYLPNVKYVQLRERKYDDSSESKYLGVKHAYSRVSTFDTWHIGLGNCLKLETIRIRLFDRLATLIYMNLFTLRTCHLVNLELDFSKLYGLPLSRAHVSEIYSKISDMMDYCHLTLRQLRIKWAVRVETDLDYARSDEDIEPFLEFLIALRNPVWMKLKLQQLILSFPTVNLGFNLCDSTLIPFLVAQEEHLRRCMLARVLPNAGMDTFVRNFPPPKIHKFEFIFHFTDIELTPQPVTVIRGIELLLSDMPRVDLSTVAGLNRGRRENGMKYYMHFKLINAHGNLNFEKPDMFRLTQYFLNVRTLELLDCSAYGRLNVQFTNADFNTIIKRMIRLVSLKMSNVSKFTDAGLTKIPEKKISYMNRTGAYYQPTEPAAPVAKAKDLRFLDLRDLPPHVSDVSVFFAFQHIKKLEKISFHGFHSITSWGRKVLESRFSRNPYFEVIFKSLDDECATFGNYVLPCTSFP